MHKTDAYNYEPKSGIWSKFLEGSLISDLISDLFLQEVQLWLGV